MKIDEKKLKLTQESINQGYSYKEAYKRGGFYPSYTSKLVTMGKIKKPDQPNFPQLNDPQIEELIKDETTSIIYADGNEELEDLIQKVLLKLGVATNGDEAAATAEKSIENEGTNSLEKESLLLKKEIQLLRQEKQELEEVIQVLTKENNDIKKEKNNLKQENQSMHEEINDFKNAVQKIKDFLSK